VTFFISLINNNIIIILSDYYIKKKKTVLIYFSFKGHSSFPLFASFLLLKKKHSVSVLLY